MTMSMESFTEPLEAIAAAQYGDAWLRLGKGKQAQIKQQLIEVLQPGLQIIIDAVNTELAAAQGQVAVGRWQPLVESELRYRGYTDEQIATTNQPRQHTEVCEVWVGGAGLDCTDGNGKPQHPEHDEAEDIAGTIGRAFGWLDEPRTALAGEGA